MPEIPYNPEDKVEREGSGPIQEGDLNFKVDSAKIGNYNGKDRVEITLKVDAGRKDPVKVFDYLYLTPKALYRFEQFCNSVGVDYNSRPSTEDLLGKEGVANFALGEPKANGNRYLEAKWYLDPLQAEAPKEASAEDIPF